MELVEGSFDGQDTDALLDEVTAIGDETDATVQVFDARYVVDRTHLERAVSLAQRERDRDNAIVRDEAVEILLYAAGRRQIDRAMEMGVSAETTAVVAVVIGGDESTAVSRLREVFEPASTLGSFDEPLVREYFDVTDRELAATEGTLADVIHERVALLVVER